MLYNNEHVHWIDKAIVPSLYSNNILCRKKYLLRSKIEQVKIIIVRMIKWKNEAESSG